MKSTLLPTKIKAKSTKPPSSSSSVTLPPSKHVVQNTTKSSSSEQRSAPPPRFDLEVESNNNINIEEEKVFWDPKFKTLPSDNVILILDFLGGGDGMKDMKTISEIITNCFGRFRVDSSIKFLYRYAFFYTNIDLDGMVFICNEQFKQIKKSTLEAKIINTLCSCPADSVEKLPDSTLISTRLDQLNDFAEKNKQLCLNFKELNFYSMQTFWELIAKCLELFPNFEKVTLGFRPDLPTKMPRKTYQRKYHVQPKELAIAFEKSNHKCKKLILRHARNVMKEDLASQLPHLEKYIVIGTDYLKQIDHLDELKNLKHLHLEYQDSRTYGMEFRANEPQFFQSLAKCTGLKKLTLKHLYLFGEEFIHLNNSLQNLTYLNLKACFCQNNLDIFNAISSFQNLKTLILGSHNVNDLENFGNLKNLEYLETSDLGPKDLVAISQLVKLKSLIAEMLYVTDKEGQVLASLKNLEQFKFGGGMRAECFSGKLISFFFKNLNVKTYEISYYGNDIPESTLQQMNGYCVRIK